MVFPRWGTSALGSQGQGQGREAGSRGRTGQTQRRTFGEELRLTALALFISTEPLLVRPGGERREGQTTVTAAHLAQIHVANGGESSGFLSSPQRLQKGRQTSVAAPRIQAAQRKCFLAVRRLGRHGGFPRGLLQPSSVSSPSPCCPAHTLPLASTPAPGGGPNTARGSHAPAPTPGSALGLSSPTRPAKLPPQPLQAAALLRALASHLAPRLVPGPGSPPCISGSSRS